MAIMFCISFLIAIILPAVLIVMTPFVIIEIIKWAKDFYFYLKEYWKEKFR